MLIQCLIERQGPSKSKIDGTQYLFEENEFGHKVCEIPNEDHGKYLLRFSWFKLYEKPKKAKKIEQVSGDTVVTPKIQADTKGHRMPECSGATFGPPVKMRDPSIEELKQRKEKLEKSIDQFDDERKRSLVKKQIDETQAMIDHFSKKKSIDNKQPRKKRKYTRRKPLKSAENVSVPS